MPGQACDDAGRPWYYAMALFCSPHGQPWRRGVGELPISGTRQWVRPEFLLACEPAAWATIKMKKNQNAAVINQIRLDGPTTEGAPAQPPVIGQVPPRA